MRDILPTTLLIGTGDAVTGCDLAPPANALTVIPRPQTLETLRTLHASTSFLAEHTPNVLSEPESTKLAAIADQCLGRLPQRSGNKPVELGASLPRNNHAAVPEPAGTISGSRRCTCRKSAKRSECREWNLLAVLSGTSRHEFQKHYLTLRRMHQAHRALKRTSASETTVTPSRHFGFWHFGRFATTYRLMFNETPSSTLHRPPE